MTGSKILRMLLAATMCINILARAGCKNDLPPYESVVSAIDTYRTNYSEYRKTDPDDMMSYDMPETARLDGTPCSSYYIRSGNDLFRSVTLEYEKNDTMMVDEYFYLTDNAFFIVNSYLDDETMTPVITRYYVWKGKLYNIDEENSQLTEADDTASAQYYLSFDKLEKEYGPQSR